MVRKFENLVESITTEIGKDMLISKKKDMIMLFLKAYNRFQEDERDGADYIFNLNEKDDLMICIDGGLKLNDIVSLAQQKATYFMFGVNHTEPLPIKTMEQLASILYAHANEVVTYALAYVTRCEEYQALYEEYVTSRIENALVL